MGRKMVLPKMRKTTHNDRPRSKPKQKSMELPRTQSMALLPPLPIPKNREMAEDKMRILVWLSVIVYLTFTIGWAIRLIRRIRDVRK